MKRKLTFLMLFMAFCSMISLGQNQGPDWGEDYSPQFNDATTTYTVSISINGVLQEHTDLEIAPYYDGKRYGSPVRLTQAPAFLGGKYIAQGSIKAPLNAKVKFKMYDYRTGEMFPSLSEQSLTHTANGSYGNAQNPEIINFITPVAEVNGTVYGSLDAAIAAADANNEVKLLGNVTLSAELAITKAININLNGNAINGTVELAIVGATITGTAANMTVTSGVEGYKAVYESETWKLVEMQYVAQVGSNKYETIQEAVNAASENATIVIIGDASDETVTVDKNLTITGSNVTLNNVAFNANGADELTVSGLSFTGNSWINSGTAEKLTVSGVTANVTPSNESYTNSRSAFISLGRSEQQQLELYVTNCNIVANGGADPILGWAAITKADIIGNTFGSESAYQTYSDCVKFMAIAQGAVFNITGNTIYSNYNGIVFGQNTTRDNAYTVNVDGNTFKGGADHIWIEISGGSTCHATIEATSNNTVNGNTFTYEDIKAHTDVIESWTSYAGVDVVKNTDGKIIGGSFAHINELLIAEGYEFDEVKGTVIRSVSGEVAYRAYINDATDREAVQVDLANVYAKSSFAVMLLDAQGNVLTETSLKAGAVNAESLTCNIVLSGNPSSSWNTEIKAELTVANMPKTIEVYADGTLVDTYENALGAGTGNDETAKYKALDCVYKEAQIGTEYYATLADAVAAAQDNDVIVLLNNVSDVDATISKKVTLNLNEKTITDAAIIVSSEVLIKNGDIKNTNEPCPVKISSNGKLTIEGVDIEASKSYRAIWVDGGELIFNSGSILATKGVGNNVTNLITAIWVSDNSDVTINGGTITVDTPDNKAIGIFGNYTNANVTLNDGKISTSGKNYSYAINVDGDITVTGGEIVTNEKGYGNSSGIRYGNNYALVTATGDVTISGGKITTNSYSGYIVSVGRSYSEQDQTVTITGGEFKNNLSEVEKTTGNHKAPVLVWDGSESATVEATISNGQNGTTPKFEGFNADLYRPGKDGQVINPNSTLLVSGGTFDREINEEYIAPGFKLEANTDGTYGVVVDPAYGKVAKIDDTYYETLAEAIAAVKGMSGDVTINLLNNATLDITAWQTLAIGGETTTKIIIDGENGENDFTLTFNKLNSDWNHVATNNNATLVLKNMTITDSGYNNGPWNRYDLNFACNTELVNVNATKALAFKAGATLNNVTINEIGDNYAIWIQANGQDVDINGLVISSAGRGIKVDEQYVTAQNVNLSVANATFTTAKKAAIMVKSAANTAITVGENVNISGVSADKTNIAWVDEDAAAHYGKVTVTGGTVSQESVEIFNVTITDNNNAIQGYYINIDTAIADAQAGETVNLLNNIEETSFVEINKDVTINGNGKTLTSSATRVIRLTASDINVTINELNMVSKAVRVGTNDIRGISVDASLSNVKLALNNCSVDFTDATATDWSYAVNVSGNGTGHKVTVDDGLYEGANVVNVWGNNNTIDIKNAKLTSLYKVNDNYHGCCVRLEGSGSTLDIASTTFNGEHAVAVSEATAGANAVNAPLEEGNTAGNTDNTKVYVAKNGDVYYHSVTEAIAAAQSGATIKLLANNIDEYVRQECNKSITILGAAEWMGEGKVSTLTGGMYLGIDNSQCDPNTIDVKGITFEGKGLKIASQQYVTIKNNTFNNITDSRAIAVIGKNIEATVENNKIDGVQIGIELRNMADATMTGNEVKNTTHNSVQVTAANPDADVTITGNTFENWGEGGEGRAIRVSGGYNIVINANKMVNDNAPESFVKITKLGETVQTINASQNYWNDYNPLALFETDGAADPVTYLINYYADAEMQNLITLSASIAKVGNEYYQSLQAAVDAADENNNTVTLLTSATGAGVVIDKDITIDFGGNTYTVNQAVGSSGTETLGFQILKSNNVTLMNGTLTSTAVTSGKEVKMLIQNYANLTLSGMNLVDNTDHILYALSNNSGTSSIEGATSITTDAVAFDVYDYTAGGYTVPTVNVSTTGKITGKIEVSETATLNISAGTFTVEIAEAWCADGFIPKDNDDGTYGVELGVFVARVNGKGYTTINAAIAAAKAGETVTILAGDYTTNITINEDITVEGERNDQDENLVNITGKLNITADGATAKNLNVNNGGSSAGYIEAKDVTVDGCTVVGGNGFRYCYTTGLVTFKNSTITGSTYGIHFDGSADGNIVIENCDITGWTSFASTITNVAISNTEFLNGNYNQLRFYQNAQMTNCKFNEAMTIDFGKNEVEAEFEGCAVVDTEGNATDAPLTDVIYLGDIAEMGIDVTIDNETVVVESRITRVNEENKEEHRYFLELTDALADVKDGETITLFADINEAVNVKTLGKEIVFDGNGFTMTAGMSFGNDDNNGDNGKITVKNVNFANANAKAANNGLTLMELAEVTVDNCNFTNITGDAIAVISDNLTETITITNNVIDGATGAGINLRTPKAATVKDNVIKNVGGNAMTFQHDSKNYDAEGDIIVTGNLMENWANNAAEGRAIRLASGSKARTFTIENNAMVKANAPEEFVKITTSEDAQATISIDKNYWNGQSPLNENVYLAEGVFPTNYYGEYQYANETLTLSNLVSINYVAQVNGVKYPSLAAAVEAAQAGETVTLLVDATGAGVVIDKNVTIDFNEKTYTVNQAVGSPETVTLGFQILKDNNVTLMNGTLTSTAVTSGKEVKMLIQNYANLTLTDMNLVDNTDHILYALSNNSGTSNINGKTSITTNAVAFDVYDYSSAGYELPTVNVNTTGTIAGKIEVSESISNNLNISGGTFTNPIAEAWCANGFIPKDNGDGTWTVKEGQYVARIGETGYEELDKAFAAAQDNDEVKILVAGTYALSTSGKDITITGAVDGVVFDNIGAKNMGGANVTFNNVTFDYYPNVNYTGLQHSGNLVYNNCTINGQVFLYGTSETFNECIFNQNSADAYNVWTYGAKDVAFNECIFNSVGKSVLIYSEQSDLVNDVTVTDCDFIASAPVDGKAAIEMDSSLTAGINLTIDDATTATGFDNGNVSGNSLWNNKKGNETEANNDITVVVNDETVLAPLTLVAAAGGINYTSLQAAYNAVAANGTITILNDVTGAGLVIDKNVTIDFNEKTYTVNQAVGSEGTVTLGFQILKNNNVTLKNGTLTSTTPVVEGKEVKMLIQNYANLTLTNMNLFDNTDHILYALSNNSGNVNLVENTNITTDAVAFDVYDYTAGGYTVPIVNVNTTGKITGAIEVSESISNNLNISGGTFTVEIAEAWCVDGYIPVKNADNTWSVVPGKFVAQVNGVKYPSLEAAVEAAQAGETVTLLKSATGAGVVINKDITIDFGGFTYSFNEGVGSTGTESNGFQILQGNDVVLKSGKLEVAAEAADKFYILVQNYANLTVEDMTLDGTNLDKWSTTDGDSYVLSNNSGTVNITGATNITANNDGDKAFAFDVCKYANYAAPTVNVNTTGIIKGKIEVSPEIPTNLNISGGTFYIDFLYEDWCAEYYSPVQDEQNSNIWTVELTGGELSRSFNKNWNWFSSYVDLSASDGSGVEKLQDALGTSGIQIKGRADGYVNYEVGEWHGSLSSILKGNMYMIKTSKAISEDEFKIAGTFVDHEEIAIELSYGWNWISYPVRESVGLSDALKDFNPKEGDQIKSYSNGFAQYSNNEWQGSLATMIPGQGYMYKSNNSTKYVYYNVPETGSRAALKANVTAEDNHWAPTSNYANNMTMIAMLNIDGEMSGNDYEIAAFANGECRGSARPIYVESMDAYMLFMTIYGEEVENLSFKYYDLNYGTEYELSDVVVYSDDAAVGSIEEPYMFNLDFLGVGETSFDEISIYPNPTTTKAEINLNATCEKVEVFNALGVKVAEYANVDTIDALETAGVYVIRITNNNDVKNCRLVVK